MEEGASAQCPICLQDCDLSPASKPGRRAVVVTHCSHAFHMGCLAEHYARDALARCPICRSDLGHSELVSPTPAEAPQDLDAVMRCESLRGQIVTLIGACVNQALRADRRRMICFACFGIASTWSWLNQMEHESARRVRAVQMELARVDRVNQDLRRIVASFPFGALFRPKH